MDNLWLLSKIQCNMIVFIIEAIINLIMMHKTKMEVKSITRVGKMRNKITQANLCRMALKYNQNKMTQRDNKFKLRWAMDKSQEM